MALPPLAEVSDLAAWIGVTLDDADPRAGAVLSAASTLVRSYCGQTFVDESGQLVLPVPDAVELVTVQVAARCFQGPTNGANYSQEQTGPFLHSQRFAGDGGGLYLTKADKLMLADHRAAGEVSGLAVLPTTRGEVRADQFLPVEGSEPMPFLPAD